MFARVFESIRKDKNLIFIPFLTLFVRGIIYFFIPHTYEDAFITFKYSENLANGFGLVYNIGEKVYGTTTPFFAIIIAFFKYFGIPCIISSLVINLISESITSLFVYKYLRDYSNEIISFFIALLFVFSPSNISWSIQGMETAFFGMLIAASFFALYKKKLFLAFLFAFLSTITRIDGLSVVFIIFLFSFIENKFSIIKYFSIPLLIFIAWLIFLQIYFGNFLPNSMLAKLILYSGHSQSMLPNLSIVLSKYFLSGYYSSALITVLFFVGIYFTIKNKLRLLPMIAWFIIYYSALIISKTQIHGWYLIPPLFVFIIVSGIGILSIYNILLKNFSRYKKLLNAIAFVFVILSSAFTLKLKIDQMNNELRYEETVRIPIGKYLNKYTPKSSTVFLEPIGVIGYYSNRYIYDDSALISPIFLEINRLAYNALSVYKKIELVKPDYLVLRNRDLDDFYTSTNLMKDYEMIKSFNDTVWFKENSPLSMTIFKRINKNIISN